MVRRCVVVAVAVAAVVGIAGWPLPSSARDGGLQAAAPPVSRIAGGDRYATAAAVSRAGYGPGVAVVYVATGETFADALAGGPAAAQGHGPVLLTQRDALPDSTRTELDRLRPNAIVVLGGTNAVSGAVENDLRSHTTGTVTRVAGGDRYATAAATAGVFPSGVPAAFVANGAGFADALAGGPAAGQSGGPVLLTRAGDLPTATADALQRLHPDRIFVLGGTSAVSDAVADQLRPYAAGGVGRDQGDNRYATAAAVAADHFAPGVPKVFLATGTGFPDALAGGPLAASTPGPLLLVQPHCIPTVTQQQIDRLAPAGVVILGGTSVVGPEVEAGQSCDATAPSGPCGITDQAPAGYDHVVIVMFENKTYSSVIGAPAAPYTSDLAKRCATSPNWTDAGSQFPSLPNYLALTSGETPISNDCSPAADCQTTLDNLFRQVRTAGGTARSYAEAMPANCTLTNSGTYAPRHNPATYFVGADDRAACQTDDLPYDQFDPDHLPTLSFVVPDLVDDTHDASVAVGDDWAKTNVQAILDGADYRAGRTAVLWLWDEDTPIPNVVISPSVRPGSTVASASHYGALRAIEEMLGLPLLGNANSATSIRGPFNL